VDLLFNVVEATPWWVLFLVLLTAASMATWHFLLVV
jgi:hypothetical protein